MFELNENNEVDRRILTCYYKRYSPAETSIVEEWADQTVGGGGRGPSVIR